MRALMAGVLWAGFAAAAHSASGKPSPRAASRPALPPAVTRHQIEVQIDKPKDRGLGWYNHFFFNEAGHLYESPPDELPRAMTRIAPDAELQRVFSAEVNDPMLGGFFQALSAAGVGFLTWVERPDFPLQAVTRLVIRRLPGTSLSVEAQFDGTLENSAGYKTSFYRALPPEQPPVRVVSSP